MFIYLVGSGEAETITYFYLDKSIPLVYCLEVMPEEFFEMFGASLLLYSVPLITIQKYSSPTSS